MTRGREAAADPAQILGVDVYAAVRQAQLHPKTGILRQGNFDGEPVRFAALRFACSEARGSSVVW